jgi:hypothetical protein
MDILLKIAIAASGVIIAVLSVGFYNLSVDKSIECARMDSDLYQHELAFNQSAEQYRYRANDLMGEYDLPGDLLAWKNHLLNDYTQLQYDIKNFEGKCG